MSSSHRFFVAQSDAVCEQIRSALDAAWGHPNDQAITCFSPASELPHDSGNRPMLAVDVQFLEYPAVAAMLPGMLSDGLVLEVSRQQYLGMFVRPDAMIP